jgi:2-polyprenyl-3-methyl-5-hydroxy-6-metoxy-1,4-benzoquinol methylase
MVGTFGDSISGTMAFGEARDLAERIVSAAGLRPMLVVGKGEWLLVSLLALGVDARMIDIGPANESVYDGRRVFADDPLLNEATATAEMLILQVRGSEERAALESWIAAVSGGRVEELFLLIGTDAESTAVERSGLRAALEASCFERGFRKHAAYYRLNDYEGLNSETETLIIPLERVSESALLAYPMDALREERNLHMDMTREVGERSDAHILRYQWAAGYVRPGDRVLDAACGLGYGSYVLARLSEASSVLGIDGSDYAIDYASRNFAEILPKIGFRSGYLPQTLTNEPDGSFDTIISFETLEHVEDPKALIAEFHRLLSPGGRLLVSVPNDWSDESGEDPNPFHLHVYDWTILKDQLPEPLLLEQAFVQTASAYKIAGTANTWQRAGRSLRQVDVESAEGPEGEWLLMVAMRDPTAVNAVYRENVYGYSSPPENLLAFERDYRNPWLVRALVEFPFRARSPQALRTIAEHVIADPANDGFPDQAAAICVLGYQVLESRLAASAEGESVVGLIERCLANPRLGLTPHGFRWTISLTFLLGVLYRARGRLSDALEVFANLAEVDCAPFSPTIGTKIIDAAFEGGMLALGAGDIARARKIWTRGATYGFALLSEPLVEFTGNMERPQYFASAIAVELLDSATRSVRALRWLGEENHGDRARIFEQASQSWKWMIHRRMDAIRDLEVMVRARDVAIAAQSETVDARWNIMSTQGEAIRQKDEVIAAQAKMLEDRWTIVEEQGEEIARLTAASSGRDAVFATLLEKLGAANTRIGTLEAVFESRRMKLLKRLGFIGRIQ